MSKHPRYLRLRALAFAAISLWAAPAWGVTTKKPSILLLGDSLMKVGVGPTLKKALAVHGVVENRAKSASGLARPDFFDWPLRAREFVQSPDLDAVDSVVMFVGANDCQSVRGASGAEHRFDTPGWRVEYRERVLKVAAILCGEDRAVYWLGLPPMAKAGFNRRIAQLDTFLSATFAEGKTCVRYVPLRSVLGDAKGRFAERLPVHKRRVAVREADGIHITQSGGSLVADALLKVWKPLRKP